MQLTFPSIISLTVATVSPQPSRASLRKKRIKKDKRGYVDLVFNFEVTQGMYVKAFDLQFVSDGYYNSACNFQISVLDITRNITFGSVILGYNKSWRIGENVTLGDSNLGEHKKFADIFNSIISTEGFSGSMPLVIRVTFDRENFYTWDRGFFIRPQENAPQMLLEVSDYIVDSRKVFICTENTIPPPALLGLHLFGADNIIGNLLLYMSSAAFDSRYIHLSGYNTFITTTKLYVRSYKQAVTPPPPSGTDNTLNGVSERYLYWTFIAGELNSQRTIYYPYTDAVSDSYYINGTYGSDDYAITEVKNTITPLRSIDAFFDNGGASVVDDYDTLYIDGEFLNTLIFNFSLKALDPTTPIVIKPSSIDNPTVINGLIACEGTACITNLTIQNMVFTPSASVTTDLGVSSQSLLTFRFCDPKAIDTKDLYYKLEFTNCKFLLNRITTSSIANVINIIANQIGSFPIVINFDTCLVGIDGPGSLGAFLNIDKMSNVNINFRNCSFLNPFNKPGILQVCEVVPSPINAQINYNNCIFWNMNFDSKILPSMFRCYNGDPVLQSDVIGHPLFGKLESTSPCYRKYLPRYGTNVGWDQSTPIGYKTYRAHIQTLGGNIKTLTSNISAKFDIRDTYMLNIMGSFIKSPYIMDTAIRAIHPEMTLKLSTEIPNVKTLIARIITEMECSYPFSTDVLYTELPLLKYPTFKTEFVFNKEVLSPTLRTHLLTGWDTTCPYVLRYGFPEYYDPIIGTKVYFYFEVFDNGTGVNIGSLRIQMGDTMYRTGDRAITIEPLTIDKTAYRISFEPDGVYSPEEIIDIEISISDCVGNKGPIWDPRKAEEILRWGGLTLTQKRIASVPCDFALSWKRDEFYSDKFERWQPYKYDINWKYLYGTSFDFQSLNILLSHNIYTEEYEYYEPYHYNVQYIPFYMEDFATVFNLTHNIYVDSFEPIVPNVVSQWLYTYYQAEGVALDFHISSFDFEVENTVIWKSLYSDIEGIVVLSSNIIYSDDFEWESPIISNLLYRLEDRTSAVKWGNNIHTDNMEWWLPYHNIVFTNGTWAIVTLWANTYIDQEFTYQWKDTAAYIDTMEWWLPYYSINVTKHIYTTSFDTTTVNWVKLYSDDTDYNVMWVLTTFHDDFEWDSPVISNLISRDTFEWSSLTTSIKIYTDRFNVLNPVNASNNFYTEDMEWIHSITSEGIYVDNFETDYLPYYEFKFNPVRYYIDAEVDVTLLWDDNLYYSDDFERISTEWKTIPLYQTSNEFIGILPYSLIKTYTFELVTWNDTAVYTEVYELLDVLVYFDPFIETFDWTPTIAWDDTATGIETFELNKVWIKTYSDLFEE